MAHVCRLFKRKNQTNKKADERCMNVSLASSWSDNDLLLHATGYAPRPGAPLAQQAWGYHSLSHKTEPRKKECRGAMPVPVAHRNRRPFLFC